MKRLALTLMLAAVSWPAHAQTKIKLPIDPLHLNDAAPASSLSPSAVWDKIINKDLPADLKYAKALADNAGTQQSKLRSTCYQAMLDANAQANGINLKNLDGTAMTMPTPAVVSTLEQGAELIDNLQPSAPLIAQCAPAAQVVKMDVLTFVNGIATGALLKVLTGGVLP